MLSWIQPVHPFVGNKLWKLLSIFRIARDFNCRSNLLFHCLLIWKWAHTAGTRKAKHLVGALQTDVGRWWLWIYLRVRCYSHIVMMLHPTSHCSIRCDRPTACRLWVHRLLHKLCEHTCSWNYSMIIMSVLLRNSLNLVCYVITIVFSRIGEMSSSTSHCCRFKIRQIWSDTSVSTS